MCEGHQAPLDWLAALVYERPALSLAIGSRGSGKSFLSGLATHIDSLRHPRHATAILGGSLAQSRQIYEALGAFDRVRPGSFAALGKESAHYRETGSRVSILAASPRSVRGPHVPTLRIDEVDEVAPELREAALGMCMAREGVGASVSYTSTWHRVGGPVGELVERARAGELPLWTFCAFEVLERCPEERSGPGLERCPECPLVKWCHDGHPLGPRAKRSAGHYAIDALVQKARGVSARVFEADYLCAGPKADGAWFRSFDRSTVVSASAAYDPALPVHLAVDSGVFTGAVAFQVLHRPRPDPPRVVVFAEYLSEGVPAFQAALAVLEALGGRLGSRFRVWTDPAGGARNPIGPTVLAEYERAGLKADAWPGGPVADGLALVEALLCPAAGPPSLLVHPSCVRLVEALGQYRRARRAGQWMDYPEDPQHPHEDLVDALRGGLRAALPDGLSGPPRRTHVHPYSVIY